jgi:large subunit ribosomal protein L17
MRHRNKVKTLGRPKASREAMLQNLASSILLYESVTTTLAKAKVVRSLVDNAITAGKKGGLTARRSLLAKLPVKNAVEKVLVELAPRYKDRASGFTRITKTGRRKGDGAETVRIELV